MALKLCKNLLCEEWCNFFKLGSRSQYSRGLSTVLEQAEEANPVKTKKPKPPGSVKSKLPSGAFGFRFIYPEFLPDPDPSRRNAVREKLERMDMMNRRSNIDIPEFYVGSVLAVKISDPHAQGKTNRFVGICVNRSFTGLRSTFTLRNVIDHQGIEVIYHLYDPTIQNIQVLRLEKRVDDDLTYLRDALPEYSTFSFDMEQEILPEGAEVPVNPLKVKMKPFPWDIRWTIKDVKGIENLNMLTKRKDKKWLAKFTRPWEKYDLMKEYRTIIPKEEQSEIWSEVYSKLHDLEITRRKMARKRTFIVPKKLG